MVQLGLLQLPIITITETPYLADNFETRVFVTFDSIARKTELGQALVERLKANPLVQAINGKMVRAGGGAATLDIERLAAWWLWRANDVGAECAEKDLNHFLTSDRVDVLGVLWIHGVDTAGTIKLTDDLRIVPLSEMPPSGDKEEFLRARWRIQNAPMVIPSAAIVKRYKSRKIKADDREDWFGDSEAGRELQDVALLLNCLNGVNSVAGYSTAYSPSEVPLGHFGGRGGGSTISDVLPRASSNFKAHPERVFAELFEKFRALPTPSRLRLEYALRRFAQAKGRKNDNDKALDLGIALEMLLLSDEHRGQELPGQLSLHFRLRGSWLIGESAAERQECYKQLGKIYSLRSQVAHNGTSNELEKMTPEARKQLAEKHMALAERIFQTLIRKGLPSNWSPVILGQDARYDPQIK
jgi:hypothetical protein